MEQTTLDNETGTEVKPLTTVAEYNTIAAGIAMMLEKHGKVLTDPPVVTGNATALATVKTSRQELVKFRTSLEGARVAAKTASLAYGKLVDTEAKRIQAFATPLEQAYDAIVTAEETRLAAIAAAELEAERQRIAGHRARIQAIKDVRETANMCRTTERIKQLIDGMPALFEGNFEEFQAEAETAFNEVCTVLQQLHDTKVEAEAQAAELQRQRDELAAQQAELARKAAIQARIADIRGLLVKGASCATSVEIANLLKEAGLIALDKNFAETFAEFAAEAEHTVDSVSEQLDAMHKVKFEAEQLAAQQQESLDAMNRRELDLQARERETADREAALRRDAEATAAKPLVSRVAEAIVGARPTFAEPKLAVAPSTPAQAAIKSVAPRRFAGRSEIDRPDDEDIVTAVAQHFDCAEAEAAAWLRDMDHDGVLVNLQQVAA